MPKYKLNIVFFISFACLVSIILMICKVFFMELNGQVVDQSGEVISRVETFIVFVLMIGPLSSYVYSALVMIRQCIYFKCLGFQITEAGIENTLTVLNVFAFIFVLPVKKIPWEGITYIGYKKGYVIIRMKFGSVKTSWLGKLILFIGGYRFCHHFVTPSMSLEEIKKYLNRHDFKGEVEEL